jgi:hypothetical protein
LSILINETLCVKTNNRAISDYNTRKSKIVGDPACPEPVEGSLSKGSSKIGARLQKAKNDKL